MRGRITSIDVAKLAGVSQSAVSRTFTPGASVAPETRSRVLAAARELGYRPNAIARSLITSRSRMIGVVMAYLDNLFYPDVLEELAERLQDRGYQVLLFTGFKDRDSDPVMGQILQYQVDGLILASTTLSSALSEECAAAGVPIVLFNRTTERDAVSSVTSDNRAGGRRIAEFLVAGGHSRCAFVAGTAASSTNRDRETGFCEGLESAGIWELVRVAGHYSREAAAQAARQLFSRRLRPDAVFCANDHMAVAVLDVARHEFGLSVPEDVSIVGYDDAQPARWPAYALTTVEQPVDEMVDRTLDILMGQIEGADSLPRHEIVPGELVVRRSARLPATGLLDLGGRRVWRKPA
jgi:DNA-binding LacI/PurR family transcriptional regulator